MGELLTAFSRAFEASAVLALAERSSSAQNVQRWLSWKAGARAAVLVKGGAGVAVIAGGVYFLYTAT